MSRASCVAVIEDYTAGLTLLPQGIVAFGSKTEVKLWRTMDEGRHEVVTLGAHGSMVEDLAIVHCSTDAKGPPNTCAGALDASTGGSAHRGRGAAGGSAAVATGANAVRFASVSLRGELKLWQLRACCL